MHTKALKYILPAFTLLALPKLALANMNGANFDGLFEALIAILVGIILNFIFCVGNTSWKNMFISVLSIILTSLQTVLAFYLLRLGGGAFVGITICALEWYLIVKAIKSRHPEQLRGNSES